MESDLHCSLEDDGSVTDISHLRILQGGSNLAFQTIWPIARQSRLTKNCYCGEGAQRSCGVHKDCHWRPSILDESQKDGPVDAGSCAFVRRGGFVGVTNNSVPAGGAGGEHHDCNTE